MQEINAHGKVIDFAMDFFEIKKHMKGEGPRAIKAGLRMRDVRAGNAVGVKNGAVNNPQDTGLGGCELRSCYAGDQCSWESD
jgi:hypothetical protein